MKYTLRIKCTNFKFLRNFIALGLLIPLVSGHAGVVGMCKQTGGCQWAYDVPDDQWNGAPESSYSTGIVGAGTTSIPMDGQMCYPGGTATNCANTEQWFRKQAFLARLNNRATAQGHNECMGGSPSDSPFYNWGYKNGNGGFRMTNGDYDQSEIPVDWRWSNSPVRPFFCPGETIEWRHYIAADHNGYHRIELLNNGRPYNLDLTENGDGYIIDDWSRISTDPNSKYYKRSGENIVEQTDKTRCSDGSQWSKYTMLCKKQVWMTRTFKIPESLTYDVEEVFRWSWFTTTELVNGELVHCYDSNGNACAEVAYFANCIPMKIGTQDQCSGSVTQTPPPTPPPPPPYTPPPIPAGPCSSVWMQCAGIGFQRTACCPGSYCAYTSDWWSACKPGRDPSIPVTARPTPPPTRSPTKSPTRTPTASPTKSPTRAPTRSPTPPPTESPTKSPTPAPPPGETLAPTLSPTQSPTSTPTLSPTLSLTPPPTPRPTPPPTPRPTPPPPPPTFKPVIGPCASTWASCGGGSNTVIQCCAGSYCYRESIWYWQCRPGIDPNPPTPRPTPPPTEAPTNAPTVSPTLAPTDSPTTSPTQAPTDSPTTSPTFAPTPPPTPPAPTLPPTPAPTGSPTLSPTNSPTVSPTPAPTKPPTPPPTPAPTPPPTLTPVGLWKVCGGINHLTRPCVWGSYCFRDNDWYWQCRPGVDPNPPTHQPTPPPTTAGPTPPPTPAPPPRAVSEIKIGGYSYGALWSPGSTPEYNKWGLGANSFHIGSFQYNVAMAVGDNACAVVAQMHEHYGENDCYYTVGGVNVAGHCDQMTPAYIVEMARKMGAVGVNFDMEGCFHIDYSSELHYQNDIVVFNSILAGIKAINPNLKLIFTPLGDIGTMGTWAVTKRSELPLVNYIAPMLYWGANTYQSGVDTERVFRWIHSWREAGWGPAEMYLTYQSESAAMDTHGRNVLKMLATETKAGNYRGLIGWQSNTRANNPANTAVILTVLTGTDDTAVAASNVGMSGMLSTWAQDFPRLYR